VYVRENEDVIETTRDLVRHMVQSQDRNENLDLNSLKNRIKDELHRHIYDKMKRNPMVLPIIIEI
jgi:ribonuclease J